MQIVNLKIRHFLSKFVENNMPKYVLKILYLNIFKFYLKLILLRSKIHVCFPLKKKIHITVLL
jgi:hypothetical protein